MPSSNSNKCDAQSHPELVFGLVGPLGADLPFVSTALEDALAHVDYKAQPIRLSHLMRGLPEEPWKSLKDGTAAESLEKHMDAGTQLRMKLGKGEALAMLAVGAIREYRASYTDDENKSSHQRAFILHSLKHPDEVKALRRIYGPAFFVVAAYAPRDRRVQNVARRIADSEHSNQISKYLPAAEALLQKDESELDVKLGQNVQKTFPLADVIINTNDQEATRRSIFRFVELLFGNSFHTPSRDEQGMLHASTAALRSSSLARQVGACICKRDGTIMAVGTNDVAACGGGLYWDGDAGDGRDFRSPYDTSDKMRENLLADILVRLKEHGWLDAAVAAKQIDELLETSLRDEKKPFMKSAQFMSSIDYVRAVHAEMAAITDCARHGMATAGAILYTTTFPCHDCAKHIVAAGISRVVYVEPYPKSLVQELYTDSISVDASVQCPGRVHFDPFVGVTPKRYTEFFTARTPRKHDDGRVAGWQRSNAVPKLPEYLPSPEIRLAGEEGDFKRFMKIMVVNGLATKLEEEKDGTERGMAEPTAPESH